MGRLRITDLHKFYGKAHALRGIDLDIPEGEFTVFVGPSGCGKSTLLRTIAGLEEVNDGRIEIDGRLINDMAPRDRDIAMVFQNYALYPYMNVFENIAFGLRARKFPADDIDKRVNQAADMLGITEFLTRLPRELSGGQRQRVAIGRAIVRDASLYLFDEPLSNLDAQLREGMRSEIKQLHQDIGKTMIYVTHDQVEAMTLADRIVLLRDGVIEQIGTPLDLFERPVSRFVAAFIGSPTINQVPASLIREDGHAVLSFNDGQQLELTRPVAERLAGYTDDTILLGIRPEHIQRADQGDIRVTIDLIQPTGSRSYGTFQLGGKSVVVELKAHDIKQAGEQLELTIDMQRILFIDPKTEKVV